MNERMNAQFVIAHNFQTRLLQRRFEMMKIKKLLNGGAAHRCFGIKAITSHSFPKKFMTKISENDCLK